MEAMPTRKGAGRAGGARRSAETTACLRANVPEFQKGSTLQRLTQEEDADAKSASDLNGVQRAGIHYRLSLTHSPPLEKRLNCTASANAS